MGTGPGIGSVGTGKGGCSGGIGTSGGTLGVCDVILILILVLVLVLVLVRLAGMKPRLILSNAIMGYSIHRWGTALFEHEHEDEHDYYGYPKPSILNMPYELMNFAPCCLSRSAISRRLLPSVATIAITVSLCRSASA